MRILLVNPSTARDILSYTVHDIPYMESKAFFAPHTIAAVAAVTPPGHQVALHDEQIRGPVERLLEKETFDLIGITLVSNAFKRTMEIVEFCRTGQPGAKLAVGGIGVSNMMPRLVGRVDVVFMGESELTWPEYLRDLAVGTPKKLYQKAAKPDMGHDVPAPRWDLIGDEVRFYSTASVQTTRGCPFDCSFCDVIYSFGRKMRSKPIAQVLDEVRTLQGYGALMVYFADDNFCGNRAYVKELLRALGPLNNSFESPLGFITQADITIADDDELLELMADANMVEVQIGIESVDPGSLADMNKKQNLKRDLAGSIDRIQSYGIIALVHMIIGSDSDDATIFDRTADFIDRAHITQHTCHPLTAPPGTKLGYQMLREGRLLKQTDELRDKMDIVGNIVPRGMTRVELMRGMADYWDEVYRPERYVKRALGFIHGITRQPKVKMMKPPSVWTFLRMIFKLFWFFLFKVGRAQRKAFLTVFGAARKKSPNLIPNVIFMHTGYLIDRWRAERSAELARHQADLEQADPGQVVIDRAPGTLSDALRASAKEVIAAAYGHVRRQTGDRAVVYEAVVQAVGDYSDRFGETFKTFDDIQRDHLVNSCDRVLAALPPAVETAGEPLPEDRPPGGFTREILDAVDRSKRITELLA